MIKSNAVISVTHDQYITDTDYRVQFMLRIHLLKNSAQICGYCKILHVAWCQQASKDCSIAEYYTFSLQYF